MTKTRTHTIVIETPKGSANWYKYEETNEVFSLWKTMPKGLTFPYDFGYIAKTRDSNKEFLSVILINEGSTFTGCKIQCHIIGCLPTTEIERGGNTSIKQYYIAVPYLPSTNQIKNLKDLCPGTLENIKSFFINCSSAQGNELKFLKDIDALEARKAVEKAKDNTEVALRLEFVLPENTSKGQPFPEKLFKELNDELLAKFGGLTVYKRTPALGFWRQAKTTISQNVRVYELMLPELDETYWSTLKKTLENKFKQTEVLITYGPFRKIY